jgi:hypothetical protein
MALQVIGTGWGRTGTDSMREALTILGFGPCHHMFEVSENPVMKARWRAFMKDGIPDWEALFEGYASAVDWPSAHYWRALAATYPDAKLILTWRSPQSWWTSFEATLLHYYKTTDDRASVGYKIIDKTFGGRPDDRDHAITLYEANIAAAIAEIPPARLLVHKLGDGWAPLCTHLGVGVPDIPYPAKNSTSEILDRIAKP